MHDNDSANKSLMFTIGFICGGCLLVLVLVFQKVAGVNPEDIRLARDNCQKTLPRNQVCELDIQFKIVTKEGD